MGCDFFSAPSSPNESDDQTGGVNKAFYLAWLAGRYCHRFKAWNRHVYQATKLALILAVGLLIIVA
jgi:beta-hydroxylase